MRQEVPFEKIEAIYNRLPMQQKKFVAPRGKFVDSPSVAIRTMNPDEKGYAEVYQFTPGEGFVSLAVSPEAQGQGRARQLLEEVLKLARRKRLETLIYEASKENKPSVHLAKKYFGAPSNADSKNYTWKVKL